MATTEQWLLCTQAQRDELCELNVIADRYRRRRLHAVETLNKARKLVDRRTGYHWGQLWINPVHVRYEAARDVVRLEHWLKTEGAELAHTICRLHKAINEILREAEEAHERRQLELVGVMFPGLTTDEQRREALQLMKGDKA